MSARMAGVATMISHAMTRPRPRDLGSSVWVITPSSTKASWARTWDCWVEGNTSMIRLIDSAAELVCRVASTRSEEHTSELSHSQISYAVFCLKKKKKKKKTPIKTNAIQT